MTFVTVSYGYLLIVTVSLGGIRSALEQEVELLHVTDELLHVTDELLDVTVLFCLGLNGPRFDALL